VLRAPLIVKYDREVFSVCTTDSVERRESAHAVRNDACGDSVGPYEPLGGHLTVEFVGTADLEKQGMSLQSVQVGEIIVSGNYEVISNAKFCKSFRKVVTDSELGHDEELDGISSGVRCESDFSKTKPL
jgi:hypothetical protein